MSTGRQESSSELAPAAFQWAERIDAAVRKGEEWAIFSLLLLLVALTFVQVFLRNLPGNPSVPWIDIGSRLLVLWVGLLGASLAVGREKHISIDVASKLLAPAAVRWTKAVTGVLSLLVITVLFHASVKFTLSKHEATSLPLFTIGVLGMPVYEWIFTDAVPPIFLLMLYHTWTRWSAELGGCRAGKLASGVAGGVTLLLVAGIAGVDVGLVELAELRGVLGSTAGSWLRAFPYAFLVVSVALALLGAPLFVVIAAIALIGHYAIELIPVQNFVADGIGGFRKSTIFLAIPLFTLAGYLMAEGNTPKRLVGLFRAFLGWLPGGVAIVALIACSFFTAFTGASGVTIIALGGLLYPILRADRYPEKFTLGLLTTGGSRGLIFPPSIPVFLLAMVMGLSWDAVTATGPFGSAVMEPEERSALCRRKVEELKAQLAREEELSSIDEKMDEKLDRLLERREDGGLDASPFGEVPVGSSEVLPAQGRLTTLRERESGGRDEFELGDDEQISDWAGSEALDAPLFREASGAGAKALSAQGRLTTLRERESGGRDEFELGDDEEIKGWAGSEALHTSSFGEVSAGGAKTLPPEEHEATFWQGEGVGQEEVIPVPGSTQVFAAGLLPGLLMLLAVAIYCVTIGFSGDVVRTRFELKGAARSLLDARWELPIPVLIGVGIFGGFFTPAEAASVTAAYTLVMQLFLYRDFGFAGMKKAFVDSIVLVGGILIILLAAMGLLNFLVVAKVPDAMLSMIQNIVPERLGVFGLFEVPRQITFLLMLNLFLLVVGCLMDIFSAILVVLPLLLPIAYRFGIHPAHLAVIFLTNLEIGYSTPPVGINLFVASLRFEKPVVRLYAASLAFLAIMLGGLLVITYWPSLSLWLVNASGV